MDVLADGLRIDLVPGLGQYQGDYPLTEARVGRADNDGVADFGVVLQCGLHLIGEDLLPARVDAERTAPEDDDAPVGVHSRQVTGERPALAPCLHEGGRGLGRIA